MLDLTSVSASEDVIGDVTDKFKPPCQRVHAVTVTVCRRPDSNRRWLTMALKATDLDHSGTTPIIAANYTMLDNNYNQSQSTRNVGQ